MPTFIEKLRALSEKQKLAIIVVIVVVAVLFMGYFWVKSAATSFSKVGESVDSMNLPKVELPAETVPVDEPNK